MRCCNFYSNNPPLFLKSTVTSSLLLLYYYSSSFLRSTVFSWSALPKTWTTRVCSFIKPQTPSLTVVIDTSKRPPILLTTVSVHLNHNQVFVLMCACRECVCIEYAPSSVHRSVGFFCGLSNFGKLPRERRGVCQSSSRSS